MALRLVKRQIAPLAPTAPTRLQRGPVPKSLPPRLDGRQEPPDALRDRLALVFGNGRQEAEGQLVGMGVVHRYELDAGVHKGCHESEVSGEPIKLGDDQPGFVLATGIDSFGLTWSTRFSRFLYFNKTAGMNVIDVAVNGNMLYHQRMLANTTHVMKDARSLIPDSMPFYKFA
jgi:hypothetical protein